MKLYPHVPIQLNNKYNIKLNEVAVENKWNPRTLPEVLVKSPAPFYQDRNSKNHQMKPNQVPGTRYLEPGARYLVPGTRYLLSRNPNTVNEHVFTNSVHEHHPNKVYVQLQATSHFLN